MTLSITSAFSTSETLRVPRSFMRSVWKPLNALSTRWTWNARALAWSAQALDEGEDEGTVRWADRDGLADGDADGLADGFGDADALADALGLADAWVMVTVVTPFCVETLTSAPVAPSRNRPEI